MNTSSGATKQTKSKNPEEMTIQSLLSYLSIVKVARRMKVTRTSVLRWIQNGYLPAVKSPFDGRWLIHPDDLSGFQRPPIGNPEWIDRR